MGEEFIIPGDRPIPSRDGSDYNDAWIMPTWQDLLDLIDDELLESCDLVVIGKLYRGSDKVGGATLHIEDTEELSYVPERIVGSEMRESMTDPFNTPIFVERLFGWWGNPPVHVSHFIVRRA